MKESLKLWAKYNLATDEKVNVMLAGLTTEAYQLQRPTYYKSLAGLHAHYVMTYKTYQTLIRKNWDGKYFVSPLTDESYEAKFDSLEATSRMAMEYGKQFAAFCEVLDDTDLDGPKTRRTMRNGKVYLLSIGEILAQYMNHTAHHRGQLSQLLDELGVDHDIGGILSYGEEVV